MKREPCPEWREDISAFQDKELPIEKMKSVQQHLDKCPACHDWLAALEEDKTLFNNAYQQTPTTGDLRISILEELNMTKQQQKPSTRFFTRPILIFSGSFALLLLIIAFTLVGSPLQQYNNHEGLPAPNAVKSLEEPAPPSSTEFKNQFAKSSPDEQIANGGSDAFGGMRETAATGTTNYAADEMSDIGVKAKSTHSTTNDGNMTFSEMERNYGIPGGIKMAFTVNYEMEVKQALQSARKAQEIIKKHGGFSIDFQYEAPIGDKPVATFHGKIPAKEAASVIDDIEKLGLMRTVNIGAEDITDQYRNAEEQFNNTKGATKEYYKKELEKLALKHNLVDFSATFTEIKVREPFTFDTLVQSTLEILRYILLALLTVGVALIVLALIIAPFTLLRHLRRREKANTAPEE